MDLMVDGAELVHMDEGTDMWIQLIHFRSELGRDDRALLAALIASPAYAHDYASPFESEAQAHGPAVHGPWLLDSIDVARFEPADADEAENALRRWADDQDWHDPSFRQSEQTIRRLEGVIELLRSGTLYKLNNPDSAAEHDYGFVVGATGFHEFVVIGEGARSVHLVVASDD